MQKPQFLMSCPACRRQYDVTHYEPGKTIRCECSVIFTVEERKPRSPLPLKCFQCGGPLEAGAGRCRFCESEISLEERRLDSICPQCFARTVSKAHFCMECGLEILPQSKQPIPEDANCPRCKGTLQSRNVAHVDLIECAGCAGLWLSPGVFEKLCANADEHLQAFSVSTDLQSHVRRPVESKVQYLPCIVCSDRMVRRNFGGRSGIVIDLCKDHGVWFDHDELQRVLEFIQKGGLEEARRLERESAEREALWKKGQDAEPLSRYSQGSGRNVRAGLPSWLSVLLITINALVRKTHRR